MDYKDLQSYWRKFRCWNKLYIILLHMRLTGSAKSKPCSTCTLGEEQEWSSMHRLSWEKGRRARSLSPSAGPSESPLPAEARKSVSGEDKTSPPQGNILHIICESISLKTLLVMKKKNLYKLTASFASSVTSYLPHLVILKQVLDTAFHL